MGVVGSLFLLFLLFDRKAHGGGGWGVGVGIFLLFFHRKAEDSFFAFLLFHRKAGSEQEAST